MVQTGLMRRILWSMVCIVSVNLSQAQEDVDAQLAAVFGNEPPVNNPQVQESQGDIDAQLTDVFGKKPVNNPQVQESQGDVDAQLADVFGKNPPASCTCMPFYKCKKNTTENTSGNIPDHTTQHTTENEYGENQLDIRIDPEQGAECQHYLDKCCLPQDQDSATSPQPVTAPPRSPAENTCGARHPDGVGFRITGDKHNEANYGEFPWMVAVIRRDKVIADITIKIMECGGSIIHPQVVLTAAHCVKGKKDLLIRAGEWDTQTDKEMYPTQDRDVKQAIVHEGYYAGGLHNDVALLVLDKPLELNDVVGTLCLPEQDEQMDGRNCVVSGWGKDVYGKEGKYQVILKRVEQPVVPKGPCQDALRKTRLGPRFRLHESFICAGGEEGKDACKGDGGSPLACPSKGDSRVYVQAGIVSWGIGCGTTTPAVYANVPHVRKWIDEKIASLNFI